LYYHVSCIVHYGAGPISGSKVHVSYDASVCWPHVNRFIHVPNSRNTADDHLSRRPQGVLVVVTTKGELYRITYFLLLSSTRGVPLCSRHNYTLAGFGFFVPYFDLDVIRFGTPPCHRISACVFSQTIACAGSNVLDLTLHVQGGISHLDNPDFYLLGLKRQNVVAHCVLRTTDTRVNKCTH
jgi:hypothetical protein